MLKCLWARHCIEKSCVNWLMWPVSTGKVLCGIYWFTPRVQWYKKYLEVSGTNDFLQNLETLVSLKFRVLRTFSFFAVYIINTPISEKAGDIGLNVKMGRGVNNHNIQNSFISTRIQKINIRIQQFTLILVTWHWTYKVYKVNSRSAAESSWCLLLGDLWSFS